MERFARSLSGLLFAFIMASLPALVRGSQDPSVPPQANPTQTNPTTQTPPQTYQERRTGVRNLQGKVAALMPGEEATIEVGSEGPTNQIFTDPSVPFSLVPWFCPQGAPTAQVTSKNIQRASDRQRAHDRECRTGLEQAIRTKRPLVFKWSGLSGSATLRVVGLNQSFSIGAGSDVRIPLDTLKNLGDRVEILVDTGKPVLPVISLTFEDRPRLPTAVNEDTKTTVAVRLDRTGVATSAFLNPRWPVFLAYPTDDPSEVKNWQQKSSLSFTNALSSDQFVVTFGGIDEKWRGAFLRENFRLTECADGKCKMALLVASGTRRSTRVPINLLRTAYVDAKEHAKVVTFEVRLLHDDFELSNAHGYFSLVPYENVVEAESDSSWHASISAQFGSTPDLSDRQATPDDDPVITDTVGRGRANDRTLTGSARIGLTQTLGNIVEGDFDLRVKSGNFGSSAEVKATKYRLNIFGVSGTTYSGGLFDIAEPSQAIALSESGENVGLHFRFIDANYIIRKYVPKLRRDVLDFEDKQAARDHSAGLVQIRRAPWLTWGDGNVDLYALFGRKKATRCLELSDAACPNKPEDAADDIRPAGARITQGYWTVGGELTHSFKGGWSGTAAFYGSHLSLTEIDPRAQHLPSDKGSGVVGLFTLGWTKFPKRENENSIDEPGLLTLRGQFGLGTGDDPDREGDQGYIGETAGFAPDEIFLAVLAPAIQSTRGQVGRGLINKNYLGVLFTTPQVSPLKWFVNRIRIPDSEIAGATTTVKFHNYSFREALAGEHRAGTEIDVDFALESPAGVTYSLNFAGFWPGKALTTADEERNFTPLVRGFQSAVVIRLTVKM